jgi:SAM-dependent methyltransferase
LTQLPHSSVDLQQFYRTRFAGKSGYRQRVWDVLCGFFARWINPEGAVLDLGAGHCEFINAARCARKIAMDLNPDVERMSDPEVSILHQDCSQPWNVDPESLDAVFTSNFFEHLPTKDALERTLLEARRALKPGGRLVAMGPNIKYLPGVYWDYFDHYLPLTELSLVEILRKCGFEVEFCRGQFLPYTMSAGRQYPIWILRLYLALPPLWRLFGKQFLVVGKRLD